MHKRLVAMVAAALGALATGSANAQSQSVDLWPGVAPGSETWTQQERTIAGTPVGTVVLNVVKPTLSIYLPDRARATGTGVIVAPGGACVALAISREGYDVARWLASRGIAAFVLKYRIAEKRSEGIPDVDMDQACKYGIADGIQALKVVRAHAAAWGVAPNRIGFLGFSAGGMIAAGALLQPDVTQRPNFAAFIYGAPFGKMPGIPQKLPPIFMAWTQTDPLGLDAIVRFYDALLAAGNEPEAHIYATGGHGFGLQKQNTPSDFWPDDFCNWLRSLSFGRLTLQCRTLCATKT